MTTAASIRSWLQETLTDTGLTVKQWAKRAGVAESTIHRALKEDYQYVTSSRTLSRLASAIGVAAPETNSSEPQMVGAEFLPIRYEVGAGNWQEISDSQVFYGSGTVAPDPAYASFPQWLERVSGDSMDREYRDGELIHVVDAFALGYAPQHGDHVVLVRRRNNGAEMERTVKEVVRTQAGTFEFWPRSLNPRWREPVRLIDGVEEDPSIEIEVAALVIGSYRPRRR
jgi:phage repressor protein C with HTH and peptisase S24 domain